MCAEKQEQDLSPDDFLGFFFFLMGLWLMYYVIILFYKVTVQCCLLVHLNIIPNKLENYSVLSFTETVIIIYYSIAFPLFFFFFQRHQDSHGMQLSQCYITKQPI